MNIDKIICGDNLSVMRTLPDCCIDAIVTDPPYGLSFMGKKWDYDVPSLECWVECLRVLKPGGHLLSFAGTRTQHRMACRIEDAGFEIRDMIAWVYGSGFPKSLDVSKAIDKVAGVEREVVFEGKAVKRMIPGADQNATGSWIKDNGREFVPTVTAPSTAEAKQWSGWGTALKPAMEPITVARKPLIGTVAANVLEYGTGGLNIDGCRVEHQSEEDRLAAFPQGRATSQPGCLAGKLQGPKGKRTEFVPRGREGEATADKRYTENGGTNFAVTPGPRGGDAKGRWPANFIHDGSDEVVGLFPQTTSGKMKGGTRRAAQDGPGSVCYGTYGGDATSSDTPGDSGSAARFFYCAKASKSERGDGNNHPTVKPINLMRYLVRLVTPVGSIVLDPFAGSGTTLVAAKLENCHYIGIELNPEYHAIAEKRLSQGVLF